MALILEPGLAREIESQLLSFSRVESTRFAAQRDCDRGYFTGRAEKNYWRDLWRYRELFIIRAWRDVPVRNRQILIGGINNALAGL